MEDLARMLRFYESNVLNETDDIAKLATQLFIREGEYVFDAMDTFYDAYRFLVIPLRGMVAGIQTTRGIIRFDSCT